MAAIFLDTYAIFQLINGNETYSQYQKDFHYITTKFNLIELYYNLRRAGLKKEDAKYFYETFSEFEIAVPPQTIIDAAEFKLQNKSKKLSYADCIGYITAKNLTVSFVTGDTQFEHMENVIFIR